MSVWCGVHIENQGAVQALGLAKMLEYATVKSVDAAGGAQPKMVLLVLRNTKHLGPYQTLVGTNILKSELLPSNSQTAKYKSRIKK